MSIWKTLTIIGCLLAGGGIGHAQQASVPGITVQQLRMLQETEQPAQTFVVVDVRAPQETSVSVIPGAITLAQFHAERQTHAGKLVIAYCTSGARSARVVRQLRSQGMDARDLRGSILAWCQAQMPLSTLDGQPTKRVHVASAANRVPRAYKAVY